MSAPPPASESAPSPIPVVCAIIERDGLILLAQRPPGKALAGLWEFPGGKVEPNESPADALHRELAEELHCTVTILQSGPPVTHAYDWGSIELHPYLCHLTPTSPAPTPQEHTALTWVLPKDLTTHPLAPADVPIVHWFCQTPSHSAQGITAPSPVSPPSRGPLNSSIITLKTKFL